MIDTEVAGNVASVKAAATWLREQLKTAVDDAGDDVVVARSRASSDWQGLSGAAYGTLAGKLVNQADDHAKRVGKAAEAVEDYAAHLRAVRLRMRALRLEATSGGLTVVDQVIQPPPAAAAVPGLPADSTPQEATAHADKLKAYDEAVAKIELYDRLVDDVSHEHEKHSQWIQANLAPAVAAAEEDGGVNALWEFAADNWGQFLAGAGLQFGSGTLAAKVKDLVKVAADKQRAANDLRRARRSGNPARRAEGTAPGARERVRDLRRGADEAAEWAKWLRNGGRFLGPVGLAVDGWFSYQQIQDGESPTGVVLSSVAGAAAAAGVVAGAGALAAAGVVTAPVWGTALAAGAAAVGVGWLVSEGWDALPDDFTNSVDDAVTDAWDATTDAAGDAWDEVTSWF